ncbi:MAG: RNA polymerase sigma factor [Colwellia sp.]|nr:RNA polymerase sigma factor [Colwellia sp.]
MLAQQGDIDAFEKIYRLFADASYALAFRICSQHSVAEDVVHDAFIKIMNNVNKFRNDGSFSGWCRRIVTYEALDRLKKSHRVHLVNEDDLIDGEELELFQQDWLDAVIDLDKLLQQLSPNYRAVFILHELEGYNHKEIAQFFEKSESFSKVTLNRAYASLKKIALKTTQELQYAPN